MSNPIQVAPKDYDWENDPERGTIDPLINPEANPTPFYRELAVTGTQKISSTYGGVRTTVYILDAYINRKTYSRRNENAPIKFNRTVNRYVRRPLRGLEIKNETFASVTIVSDGDKSNVESAGVYNSSIPEGKSKFFTTNFMLSSITETRSEKHQPVPTFGQDLVYFFGEHPRMVNFQGILLNSANFRWEEEWWANYDEHFRGTQLTSKRRQVRITYDETVLYGYLTTCMTSKDAQNPFTVAVTFTVYVSEVMSTREHLGIGRTKPDDPQGGFGIADYNLWDEQALKPIKIGADSARIRKANIAAYRNQTGMVGKILGSLMSFDAIDKATSLVTDLVFNDNFIMDFLYGRNLVIPISAAYDEIIAGNPSYAEGSSINDEIQSGLDAGNGFWKGNRSISNIFDNKFNNPIPILPGEEGGYGGERREYFDNYDEYPMNQVFAVNEGGATARPMESDPLFIKAKAALKKAWFYNEKDFEVDASDGFFSGKDLSYSSKKFADWVQWAGKITFGAMQLGIAKASHDARKKAADTGANFMFPDEKLLVGSLFSSDNTHNFTIPGNWGAGESSRSYAGATTIEKDREKQLQDRLLGEDNDWQSTFRGYDMEELWEQETFIQENLVGWDGDSTSMSYDSSAGVVRVDVDDSGDVS